MLTALLIQTGNGMVAPARLIQTFDDAKKIVKAIPISASWLLDPELSEFWPEPNKRLTFSTDVMQWTDSLADHVWVTDSVSLRQALPQLDRLLVLDNRFVSIDAALEQEAVPELQDLTLLGFSRQIWPGTAGKAVFWARTACRDLLAALTAAGGCDLHLHTDRSDGADSPETLVDRVLANGLNAFAITDHDNLSGLLPAKSWLDRRMLEAGREIIFVPGVELSVDDGHELHLLGYFPRGGQEIIEDFLLQQRVIRQSRNQRLVSRLQDLGYPISLADFEASGEGTIGRLQAAIILRDKGHFQSTDEAFEQLLGFGRPGFVDRPRPTAAQAIWLIRQAGGVAVLAHPANYGWCGGQPVVSPKLLARLEALKAAGLQGVEAFHGEAAPEDQIEISAAARALGLIRTAGSDDHGANKTQATLYSSQTMFLQQHEILVAAALIKGPDSEGCTTYLLTRRSTPGHGRGLWELPGGKVEPGETPAVALARELHEELGVSAEIGRQRQVLSFSYPAHRVILVSLEAVLIEKTWQLSVHDDARFVTAQEALTMALLSADYLLFEYLLA